MKRSKLSLSHYKLLTAELGELIPVTWLDVLPGDSIQARTSALIRVTPPVAPIYHPVRIRFHWWFAANRYLWDNGKGDRWEDFITGGEDGNDASVHPYILFDGVVEKGSIADHLGVPPGDYTSNPIQVNALPFRAYSRVFNDWYRDQQLVNERVISVKGGGDTETDLSTANVSWEKDYFTTARPFETLGNEVLLPISGSAPVTGIGKEGVIFPHTNVSVLETGNTITTYANANQIGGDETGNAAERMFVEEDPNNQGAIGVYADLAQATGISVNDLREALAIQRYQEARNQYGARYVEYLRYLGIRPQDARLNNPEFCGGSQSVVQFSEVLQTSPDTGQTGETLGQLGGHGISAMRTRRTRRFFSEHGVLMCLMSVVPKSVYTEGLERMWNREVKEDYFQKELQYLGDQRVLNKEIYANQADQDETFGYQNRYDEYRYKKSLISGDFRDTLNFWHYARDFASAPALNSEFVECVPTKRVYREQTANPLWIYTQHSIQARRMMKANPMPRTF